MDHPIEFGHAPVLIADQGEVEGDALGFLDILGPAPMITDGIHRQAENLHITLVEKRLQLGQHAQFGGADRREVLGVGEEDAPSVSHPLMETGSGLPLFRPQNPVPCRLVSASSRYLLMSWWFPPFKLSPPRRTALGGQSLARRGEHASILPHLHRRPEPAGRSYPASGIRSKLCKQAQTPHELDEINLFVSTAVPTATPSC